MTARLPVVALLAAVWVALWERLTAANVVGGIVVALAVAALFPQRPAATGSFRLRPVAFARFLAYFTWKLVEANVVVAWEIVTPRNRSNEGIVAIPLRGVSGGLTTVVANAISLTPGTLTIDVDEDPCVLYVHALHLRDPDALRSEVRHLEGLAIRAFGPASAVAALGDEDASMRVERSHATEVAQEEGMP